MIAGTVVELWRYPVKSMGGERLERTRIDGRIPGDRAWGVFDLSTGRLLSAKTVPALLAARARREGDETVFELPGGQLFIAGSAAANRALDGYLGRAVAMREPGDEASTIDIDLDDGDGAGPVGVGSFTSPPGMFYDSRSTLHLVSVASLAALDRDHTPGAGDTRRWRPNLVISGIAAFAEDRWVGVEVRIGTAVAHVRKLAERCVLPSRAQPGVEADRGLLRYLKAHREFCVGIYLDPRQPGEVAVGDRISA